MHYLKIKVFPAAKKDAVLEKKDSVFEIYTKEAPALGKANKAALALLAAHLHIPAGKLRIIRGGHKQQKIVGIIDSE